MMDLGGMSSFAHDINNAGQVIGSSSETAAGEGGAFIWERGTMRQLPDLERPEDDGGGTMAMGINGRGQVVGTSGGHAVLWS